MKIRIVEECNVITKVIFILTEKLTMLETQRIIQVACGDEFTVVLNSDNQLYAFGANDKGQLGSEVRNFIPKPR